MADDRRLTPRTGPGSVGAFEGHLAGSVDLRGVGNVLMIRSASLAQPAYCSADARDGPTINETCSSADRAEPEIFQFQDTTQAVDSMLSDRTDVVYAGRHAVGL